MARPEYPEKWKRERMLWFVHEWPQENLADEDPVPHLMSRCENTSSSASNE